MASLEDEVLHAESIISLEKNLNKRGISFKNLSEYLNWLSKMKLSVTDMKMSAVKHIDPEKIIVPRTTISAVNNAEYKIYGIIHGYESNAKLRLSDDAKHMLKEKILSIINTRGTVTYLEQGFLNHFNIQSREQDGLALEIRDVDDCPAASPKTSVTKIGLILMHGLAARSRHPFINQFMADPIGEMIQSPVDKNLFMDANDFFYFAVPCLKDAKKHARATEMMYSLELPQPLNLENEYLRNAGTLTQTQMRMMGFKLDLATSVERSLFMARTVLESNHANLFGKGNLICGASHTTEAQYFLNNPSYSFKELEEYRIDRSQTKLFLNEQK